MKIFYIENQYKKRVSAFRRRNGTPFEIENKQKNERKQQMKKIFNLKHQKFVKFI